MTGITANSDFHSKQLGVLRSVKPELRRVGVLTNPRNPTHAPSMLVIRNAAKKARIDILEVAAGSSGEIEPSLATLKRERAEALICLADAVFFLNNSRIAELALKDQLLWLAPWSESAVAGALFSYGEPAREFMRRAARPVDRILKGAKPADLPVEQPNLYEMVVNLRTAKTLGLSIPQSVLLQATRVIE